MPIAYKSGYKYQLASDYVIDVDIYLTANTQFLVLDGMGSLFIKSGYAWDGSSGPARDDRTNLRASLVHDALFQLIRNANIPQSTRLHADEIYRRICLEDGMSRLRAAMHFKALRMFGGYAAQTSAGKKVLFAP